MQRLSFFTFITSTFITLSGLATTGCGGDDDDDAPAPNPEAHIEIAGTWENSVYGEIDVIDDRSWSQDFGDGPSEKDIVDFSNAQRFAIVSGPSFSDPDVTAFDRVVWTKPEGDAFYSCTATYGCASAEETAEGNGDDDDMGTCDAPLANDSDPGSRGCGAGDFPWTKYTKQ